MTIAATPWIAVGRNIKSNVCRDRSTIARCDSRGKFVPGCDEANAERIVACVNALAGLNPEAVKGVVQEAIALLENAEYADGQATCLTQDCEALEAALRSLKGA